MFAVLQTEFMTPMDQGEFVVSFKSAPGASIAETRGRLEQVLKALGECTEVKYTYATIGAGDADTVRDATVFVKLEDRGQRKSSLKQFLADGRAGDWRGSPASCSRCRRIPTRSRSRSRSACAATTSRR